MSDTMKIGTGASPDTESFSTEWRTSTNIHKMPKSTGGASGTPLRFSSTVPPSREEIRLQAKRRLRDRQKQNTNRILNHGGPGDHGGNRGKHTVSMKSGMQFYCPAIEPLVLRVLHALRGKIKIIFDCGRSPRT